MRKLALQESGSFINTGYPQVYLSPAVQMNYTMAHNLAGKFDFIVNLDDHDNKEIKRAVLPRTTKKYKRALMIFDKHDSPRPFEVLHTKISFRFLSLHPGTCSPPDIRTYKAFLEFYPRNTPGRLDLYPTDRTIEGFRREFETALARERGFSVPDSMSNTMQEVCFCTLVRWPKAYY